SDPVHKDSSCRRFDPQQIEDYNWVKSRSQESYVRNYYIVFPNDERLAGRNFQKGPFHQELVDAGCIFQERQGKERPGWFSTKGAAPVPPYDWFGAYGHTQNTDHRYENQLKKDHTFGVTENHKLIGEECLACRQQVALFDMSSLGKFYLCGPEAQKAADWLFTADTHHPIGKTVYTCLLNSKAGVEADITVSTIETGTGGQIDPIFKGHGFYMTTAGGSSYHTWAHIKSVLNEKKCNVDFTDVSERVGVLSVQGPNSRALLQPLLDVELDNETFPYATTKLVKAAGHLCRAIRISFVGEMGWELHIPWDSCLPVYKALWAQGVKHGLRHAGYRALSSLSSEKGYHLWHFDLQICDNPLEAGLDFVCRETGDYLGKAVLDVIRQRGLTKKLLHFQLKKNIPIWGFEAIWRDDQVVGYIRRGEFAYSLGSFIGQGYVKHPDGYPVTFDYLENGCYQVEVMGKRHEAIAYCKSPFDPNGKRLLGIYEEPLLSRQ
ncbi:Sarcosine dehydrogenase, mitochondrial, partial [Cryptotermes secundus]